LYNLDGWKGSYEIGTALWGMSLNYNWVNNYQSSHSTQAYNYLDMLVKQIKKWPANKGFFFEGAASLNSNLWSTVGSPAVSIIQDNGNNALSIKGNTSHDDLITTIDKSFDNFIFESKVKMTADGNELCNPEVDFRYTDLNNRYFTQMRGETQNDLFMRRYQGGNQYVNNANGFNYNSNVYYQFKIAANADNIKLYIDGSLITDYTDNGTGILSGGISLHNYRSNYPAYFDDVRVRKYALQEPTTSVGFIQSPPLSITNPGAQTACDSYALPTITGTNLSGNEAYYDDSQANLGENLTGAITTSRIVWIYDANGICSDEESFMVTIINTPTPDNPDDVLAYGSYILPALIVGDYYTATGGPGGTGTELLAGASITSTTTLFVYAETGTTPNCWSENSFEITINAPYQLSLTTFLQGVYAGSGAMNTILRTAGQLPNTQPFNEKPWNYEGTETLPSPLSPDVVDWVLVELRSDESTMLEKKAGLLYKDGSVRVNFSESSTGGDYVVLWHRNHMPVMSQNKVSLPVEGAQYNLSSAANLYGTNPAILLEGSTYGMIAGDVTHDGILYYSGPGNDRGAIISKLAEEYGAGATINSVVSGGYWFEDVNLNNELKYINGSNDRAYIISNLNALTGNSQINAIYYSVVPGAYSGSKIEGTNDGPFDIQISDYGQTIAIELITNEPVVNGLVDNIQFTLSWKAGDTGIAELLGSYSSTFMIEPQGEPVQADGIMHQPFVSVTPTDLPEIFNPEETIPVIAFENSSGQSIAGRLWIADDDFTSENNGMYYVSVWGNNFTGNILSLSTGITDLPSGESLKIYPNPVLNSSVRIALNLGESSEVETILTEIQGKYILSDRFHANTGISIHSVNLQGLNQGVYLIRVSWNNRTVIEKLIIK
jgi:hypothetical protein